MGELHSESLKWNEDGENPRFDFPWKERKKVRRGVTVADGYEVLGPQRESGDGRNPIVLFEERPHIGSQMVHLGG